MQIDIQKFALLFLIFWKNFEELIKLYGHSN